MCTCVFVWVGLSVRLWFSVYIRGRISVCCTCVRWYVCVLCVVVEVDEGVGAGEGGVVVGFGDDGVRSGLVLVVVVVRVGALASFGLE